MCCVIYLQLFQHLFATTALFKQFKAPVHFAIHADRFAEQHKIGTLNKRQNRGENDDIDDWFGRNHDIYSATMG